MPASKLVCESPEFGQKCRWLSL